MGHDEAGLLAELLFLRLRPHADSIWNFGKTLRIQVLPRRGNADKLDIWASGANFSKMGLQLADGSSIHSRPGRGK